MSQLKFFGDYSGSWSWQIVFQDQNYELGPHLSSFINAGQKRIFIFY